MRKCIIVCNGDVENYKLFRNMFDNDSFVICADGGSRHLRKAGILPNIIIGDMDSSTEEDINYFRDIGTEIKNFSIEKNFTDAELAFSEALDRGFESIIILSCTGSRLDHTLANIYLLKKAADKGVECYIQNEKNRITLLKGYKDNNEHQLIETDLSKKLFKRDADFKISLVPISLVCTGVSITGVKYPLNDAVITMGEAIGISNEFTEETACVTVKDGLLLVILAKD